MKSWRTTFVGILKLIGAAAFVGVKLYEKKPVTEEDLAIAGALASGGIGSILAADAPKKDDAK